MQAYSELHGIAVDQTTFQDAMSASSRIPARPSRTLIWLKGVPVEQCIICVMEVQIMSLPEPPLCPNCTMSMILSRTWPRDGGLSEMKAFECKRCSIVFTEMVTGDSSIPERLSVLHFETYSALQ
jgi:hypothetical protein